MFNNKLMVLELILIII